MSIRYQVAHFYLLTSKYVLAGCLLLLIAFVFHLIGFSSPYWYYESTDNDLEFSSIYFGLWIKCTETDTISVCESNLNKSAMLQAAQVLECFGMITLLAAMCCIVLYLFVIEDSKPLIRGTGAFTYSAALFILIGGILFVVDVTNNNYTNGLIHFSFASSIFGAISAILSGMMFVIDNKRVLTV